MIAPIPCRLPARRQRNEIIVQIDATTTTSFPYLFPKTSGRVSALSTLILRARKTAFKMRERPRPSGRTALSQNEYLYERVAAPRMALESMD